MFKKIKIIFVFCALYSCFINLCQSEYKKNNDEKEYINRRFGKTNTHGTPRISIIIFNFGLSGDEQKIIELFPTKIAYALTSYFNVDDNLIKKIQSRGHEVYLTIPAPNGRIPGEADVSLMNESNFKIWLSKLVNQKYKGLLFEQAIDGKSLYVKSLINFIHNNHLSHDPPFFIMVENGMNSTVMQEFSQNNLKYVIGDKVIYASDKHSTKVRKLDKALKIAELTGEVIISISLKSYEEAKNLMKWLLKNSSLMRLVPISDMTMHKKDHA